MTPSSGCTMPRSIVHEIMHGVSFYHTHMRRDRDEFVIINWDNIRHHQIKPRFSLEGKRAICGTGH